MKDKVPFPTFVFAEIRFRFEVIDLEKMKQDIIIWVSS